MKDKDGLIVLKSQILAGGRGLGTFTNGLKVGAGHGGRWARAGSCAAACGAAGRRMRLLRAPLPAGPAARRAACTSARPPTRRHWPRRCWGLRW